VDSSYRELAAADPARFRVIDAAGPPEQVLAAALAGLDGLAV
jgi:thymidylate kinase